jgi:protein SCO1
MTTRRSTNSARRTAILAGVAACAMPLFALAQQPATEAPAKQPADAGLVIEERASGVDEVVAAPESVDPSKVPYEARGLDVEEKVGSRLPMDLQFTNAEGKLVALDDYFDDENGGKSPGAKPAVIVMAYYHCPVVCKTLIDKLVQTLNGVNYVPGQEYNLLVFSFDPKEDARSANVAKELYVGQYNGDEKAAQEGFQFHVGTATASRTLADSLGFRYKFLTDTGEFSHPVVVFLATPEGRVSRYLYGYEQAPRDMRLAIMEASEGKLVRTIGERLMNFCYMYDPTRGTYTLQAFRVMQIGGALSLVLLSALVGGLLLYERSRKRAGGAGKADGGGGGSSPPLANKPPAPRSTPATS